ncbi:MAG: hypothetical protein R2705_01245 [Ilumatobacteraceae bacterium]
MPRHLVGSDVWPSACGAGGDRRVLDDQAELQQDVRMSHLAADVATTITDAAGEVSQDAVEAA